MTIKLSNLSSRLFFMLSLGGFIVLSFPPFNYFIFFMMAVVLITYIIFTTSRFKDVLLYMLSLSLGLGIFGCYWIVYSTQYVMQDYSLSLLSLLGFCVLYAIFLLPTFFLIWFARLYISSMILIFFVVWISWSMWELLKLFLFGGFPWFMSASIWDFDIYFLQLASIVGEFGLGIITYLLISLLYVILFSKKRAIKIYSASFFLLILFISHVWGYLRVHSYQGYLKNNNHKIINIRMVQTNIQQSIKQNPYYYDLVSSKLIHDIFKDNNKSEETYIILPETAFNHILEEKKDFLNYVQSKANKNIHILMGSLRRENNKLYNSFYYLNRGDMQWYDKRFLVPFGEFIPLSNLLPFIGNLVGLESLSRGDRQKIITTNSFKFAPLICFEGVVPNVDLLNGNIDFIVNIANEGWFNSSIEFEQNMSLTRFRALESGVHLIKVANTGKSVIINAIGEVVASIPINTREVLDIKLLVLKKQPIYNFLIYNYLLIGVIFLYMLLFLIILIGKYSVLKFFINKVHVK